MSMYGKLKLFLIEHGKIFVFLISILILLIALAYIVHQSMPKALKVSFLDVGQGDAILIQTPGGHDMLIDGGPSDSVLSQLSKEMSFFDRDLDVVIATHGDADHITGLIPVLKKYNVHAIVQSPISARTEIFEDLAQHIEEEQTNIVIGRKGDVIDFSDGVLVRVLHPVKTISSKTEINDASVSVLLTYGDHSFLLTGDLTSKYEPKLIGTALPKHVTVYKAGHHGSKTSSSKHLLSYIKPEYAVISAGRDNRYGHPNEETVERLTVYAKEILGTYDRGTITFVSDGRKLVVKTDK
jgi:competence protein ComEC